MKFTETKLKGAFVIELERFEDNRGFFARTFCKKEFEEHGLDPSLAQISIAYNKKKGTIRGMHFQLKPYEEVKVVQCTKGSVFDVVIDLRSDSKTFKQWASAKLSSTNYRLMYIPKGFAHGYQTLEDNTEVIYHISEFFNPDSYRGVRWNDPAFKIMWPNVDNVIISDKDKNYPDFRG